MTIRLRVVVAGSAILASAFAVAGLGATAASAHGPGVERSAPAATWPLAAPVPPRIAGSVSYLTSRYGVSKADAIRRLDLQSWASRIEPVLARRFPAVYAGMWLDQARGGILYIAATRPGQILRWPGLRAQRRWIRAVPVSRSRLILARLQARLQRVAERLRGWTSIDDQRDQVAVWAAAEKLPAMARAIERLHIRAGAYAIHAMPVMHPVSCVVPALWCDPPLRGGMELTMLDADTGNRVGNCTGAFNVHGSDGGVYMITAGHCFGASPNVNTAATDNSGNLHIAGIATSYEPAVKGPGYPNDYAIVPYIYAGPNAGIAYWIPPYQPQYEVESACGVWPDPYGGSCTSNDSLPMNGMYAYNQIGVGWTVCATGARTGTICGSVTGKDGGIVTNICRKSGDSGGPLFSQIDDMAYGITSGATNGDPNNPCQNSDVTDYTPLSSAFANATSQTGVTYSLATTGGGVTASQHAKWVSDSYNGAPLTSVTLNPGQVSAKIYITEYNQGPGTWDANTVLAFWSGSGNGPPGDGTTWCHAPGSDWSTCLPGVPAWAGTTTTPGHSFTFEFQIQANSGASSTTLYFRPAERQPDGSYQWINNQSGSLPYDYFTVHITNIH